MAEPQPRAAARKATGLLQRKCACGGTSAMAGECEECRDGKPGWQRRAASHDTASGMPPVMYEVLRSPGAPLDAAARSFMEPRFGHDFSRVRVLSEDAAAVAPAVNDQTPTQSGGLGEEFMQGGTQSPATAGGAEPGLNLGEETTSSSGTPVVDRVELVTSSSGAVGGYPAREDLCDASLNTPEPFNDAAFRGSVANVHQVHFHLSQGSPTDVRAVRVVNRSAEARGQKFDKSGNDGPPLHEYQFTKDKLVVADAPGWCRTLTESDFPVTYKGDFSLYAFDPLTKKTLASISYRVEISKTHYSQGDPVNTVSVTGRMIGGGVASPVKKGQKT